MAPAPWRIAGKHPGQTVLPPRENTTSPLWVGHARCTSAKGTTKPRELGKYPGGMMLQRYSTPREYVEGERFCGENILREHHPRGARPHMNPFPVQSAGDGHHLTSITMIQDRCSHPTKSGGGHFPTATHILATLALSIELGRGKKSKSKK